MTPTWIIDGVLEVFGGEIDLDPCWHTASKVPAETRLTAEDDGLTRSWSEHHRIYINPPYGRGIAQWAVKALETHRCWGSEVIMLIPAAVDTRHWQDIIFPSGASVCFLRGRLRFMGTDGQATGPAPMACALVYWGRYRQRLEAAFWMRGFCV